ncbi:MAG TPA: DUF5715 family protein [Gemmatimonadaceae bacterium]|nr:DUF5715 family protein [Gemmatimonadaceae bacterium]
METQHEVALENDYSFVRRPADVARLVELGRLVPANGNADYALSKVSFPYARPEVLSFIEHFAREYREFTGNRLVVTSLTRPKAAQPGNAHKLSVHPAGMAVDLRVPADPADRRWFEARLLELEEAGAIDVTREKRPPHYHIAVFGEKYLPIAARQDSVRAVERAHADSIARAERMRADSVAMAGALERGSKAPILLGALTALLIGAPVIRRNRRRTDR